MTSRTLVVTGAGSGIGKALSDRLRSQGDRVIGVDVRGADLATDLADPKARHDLIAQIEELTDGLVDGVAAVAGVAAPMPVTAAVNYFGAVDLLEGLRPLLARSKAPRAVVVASLAAIDPFDPELLAAFEAHDEAAAVTRAGQLGDAATPTGASLIYTTSKRAVADWARRLAPTADWAGAGIAINAIAPGVVQTPMMAAALATEESRAAVATVIPSPLNGPAAPSAPAALLNWLLSEENTHVTGQLIFIDGGAESVLRAGTGDIRER